MRPPNLLYKKTSKENVGTTYRGTTLLIEQRSITLKVKLHLNVCKTHFPTIRSENGLGSCFDSCAFPPHIRSLSLNLLLFVYACHLFLSHFNTFIFKEQIFFKTQCQRLRDHDRVLHVDQSPQVQHKSCHFYVHNRKLQL